MADNRRLSGVGYWVRFWWLLFGIKVRGDFNYHHQTHTIVNLLIMPIIGALTGGLNFDEYFLPLSGNVTSTVLGEAQKQGAVLAYGAFITVVINFLLVAFVLFQLVKAANRLKKAEPPPPAPAPSRSEELLAEIRDSLKARSST